jgi:tyrosine-protein phosphatase SIW14
MNKAIPLIAEGLTNFRLVDDGLYAGARPSPQGLDILSYAYKVKTIIDLEADNKPEYDEAVECGKLEITLHSIPLPGLEIITEPHWTVILSALESVYNALRNARPIYLHCLHGSDRTGAVIGMYRIDQGWTADAAIAEMRTFGNAEIEFGYRDFVRDYAKRKATK